MNDILDFGNKSPDDPEVIQAKNDHKTFFSPLGKHFWIEGVGYVCDDASHQLRESKPEMWHSMKIKTDQGFAFPTFNSRGEKT